MPVSKEDAIKEANSMIDLVLNDARKNIVKAIESGGINLSGEDNEVLVGKIISKAAFEEAIYQWLTISKKDDKKVKNLISLI